MITLVLPLTPDTPLRSPRSARPPSSFLKECEGRDVRWQGGDDWVGEIDLLVARAGWQPSVLTAFNRSESTLETRSVVV